MPEETDTNAQKERSFEVGMDEAWKANIKRTYDELLDLSLTSARRAQANFDTLQALTLQHMQNCIESANMVAKQAIRHGDLAIDAQWVPGPGEENVKDTPTGKEG